MPNNRRWNNPTSIISFRSQSILPEYGQWSGMLKRCNTVEVVGGKNQTYVDCTHDPSWLSYDTYIEWAREQVGFLCRDPSSRIWAIDKDLLVKGNKRYSPEVCVFVPNQINCFINTENKFRGDLPVGVYLEKCSGKYKAQLSTSTGRKNLGRFTTPTEAFQAYKVAKEAYAKLLAIKYTGLVDTRVIDALNNFTVNIDD